MPPFTTKLQKSTSLVGDLPENLMVDILSRLPVKTIIHCKFVCKKWLDLLSDSYFANLHLLRSPAVLMIHHDSETELTGCPNPGILKWVEIEDELDHHNLHHDPVMSLDLNLAPILQNTQIRQMGSANGLICLYQIGREDNNIYICNPITREYMILPRLQQRLDVDIINYGFGVGLLTQEYKVIRIFRRDGCLDPTSPTEVKVYTVGTGQWRSLSNIRYRPNGMYCSFLNGHAHWIVYHNFCRKICVFDFDTETFDLFSSPPFEASIDIKFQVLGLLKGCLCLCDTDDLETRIWVMKEYGIDNSWHKEVVIKRYISPDLDCSWWYPVYPIEGLKDGNILIVYNQNKLLAYCPQTKTFVDMKMFDCFIEGLTYHPSFLKLQNFESERVNVF